jgi:hypothetical protein
MKDPDDENSWLGIAIFITVVILFGMVAVVFKIAVTRPG